jgi:hypothetical protein
MPALDAGYVALRDAVLPGEDMLGLGRRADVRCGFRRELRPPSTTAVLGVCDGLQVVGVDAGADTAHVVKLGSLGHGAVSVFVVNAMGQSHAAAESHLTVSLSILR